MRPSKQLRPIALRPVALRRVALHRISLRRIALRTVALSFGASAAFLYNPATPLAGAQERRVESPMERGRVEPMRWPESFSIRMPNSKRAVIGVTTTPGNDTLGVLVGEVDAGGPADKAGLKPGARITAVNGVTLRVNSADAADPELSGLAQRRLVREIGKLNPGDDVELRVSMSGSQQTLKIKTMSAGELAELNRPSPIVSAVRAGAEKRASLGVSLGSSGNVRDTLGLFISSVMTNGPAEKAGIFEGDRVAAINGVDVRVPREDAEDVQASMARVNRFMRELAKLAPGDKATLRVFGGGRYREVSVTTGNSADLMQSGFRFNFGDGMGLMNMPDVHFMPGGAIRSRSGTEMHLVPGAAVRAMPRGQTRIGPEGAVRSVPGIRMQDGPESAARSIPGIRMQVGPEGAVRSIPGIRMQDGPEGAVRSVPGIRMQVMPGGTVRKIPAPTVRRVTPVVIKTGAVNS